MEKHRPQAENARGKAHGGRGGIPKKNTAEGPRGVRRPGFRIRNDAGFPCRTQGRPGKGAGKDALRHGRCGPGAAQSSPSAPVQEAEAQGAEKERPRSVDGETQAAGRKRTRKSARRAWGQRRGKTGADQEKRGLRLTLPCSGGDPGAPFFP